MRSLINEVADEGVFDRELSENDVKIGTLPEFKDFDPGTPEGSLRWLLMQELLEYFGQAPDPEADEHLAFEEWKQIGIASALVEYFAGVPQGGIWSPKLWNFHIRELAQC